MACLNVQLHSVPTECGHSGKTLVTKTPGNNGVKESAPNATQQRNATRDPGLSFFGDPMGIVESPPGHATRVWVFRENSCYREIGV